MKWNWKIYFKANQLNAWSSIITQSDPELKIDLRLNKFYKHESVELLPCEMKTLSGLNIKAICLRLYVLSNKLTTNLSCWPVLTLSLIETFKNSLDKKQQPAFGTITEEQSVSLLIQIM